VRVDDEVTAMNVASAAVVDVCERIGADVGAILADAGVDRAALARPQDRIASTRAAALMRAACARTGDAALPLRAAESVGFGAYQVVDYVTAAAPTLGAAFEQLAVCFPLINPDLGLVLERANAGMWIRLVLHCPQPRPYVEYALAAVYLRTCGATRVPCELGAAELAFPPPPAPMEHERVFGCAVRFGAAVSGILVTWAAWHTPLPGSDPVLFAVLREHVAAIADPIRDVRAAIRERFAAGDASIAAVARRLSTSVRSLQRRLRRSGASYAAVLDDERLAAARTLLLDPRRSLGEVAALVGFTQQSSFSRAFRRWTSETPNEFRARGAR
jgi:AraC-like DNA-binding protein